MCLVIKNKRTITSINSDCWLCSELCNCNRPFACWSCNSNLCATFVSIIISRSG